MCYKYEYSLCFKSSGGYMPDCSLSPKSRAKGDITAGEIFTNEIRSDVIDTFEKCLDQLKTLTKSEKIHHFLMVYRSVPKGGVASRLKKFAAKPLMCKAKSIDKNILKADGTDRLSGLLPEDGKLGKGHKTVTVQDFEYTELYHLRKEKGKSYDSILCYNIQKKSKPNLFWGSLEKEHEKPVIFCADDQHRAYVWDWDLVTVAIPTESFDRMKRSGRKLDPLEIDYNKKRGILPNFLCKAIEETQEAKNDVSVTCHGPESLYCGNNIRNDNMFIISNMANLGGEDLIISFECISSEEGYFAYSAKAATFFEWLKDVNIVNIWKFYKFGLFDGYAHKDYKILFTDKEKRAEVIKNYNNKFLERGKKK